MDDLDNERLACLAISPSGFHLRAPPPPHELTAFLTADTSLFQTIHMGPPLVDLQTYHLVITGLVSKPYTLTIPQLRALPSKTITSFHECYGSPLTPPTTRTNRIGNVTWTGVPLRDILALAGPLLPGAEYVWSDGLDSGIFAKVSADRYRKDVTLSKAMQGEVLVAYEMNGEPLEGLRGGPVRLVVPGWFGTNSTKWLCRLTVADRRAEGPFTGVFYNEVVSGTEDEGLKRPVWGAEVNSIIVKPGSKAVVEAKEEGMKIEGWAWSEYGVAEVEVSVDEGETWVRANVKERKEYEWQGFDAEVNVKEGSQRAMSRARCKSGAAQPMHGRRNHVHKVEFAVV
jgi:DMSO/TMAO reductase YedYZ molybdopterin-dependent catalytic subunit